MPVSVKGGYGVISQLTAVSSDATGANVVVANVGVAIFVLATRLATRLAHLRWRIDLAPDVPAGSVSAPTKWRLVVFSTGPQFPSDVTALQTQAFPAGSHPEIPFGIGMNAPVTILHDEWLDLSQGDPGLNELASREWSDAGPSAGSNESLCIALVPILDANMDQTIISNSNAMLYLEAYGRSDADDAGTNGPTLGSVPRYDIARG